ncbi:myosin light chain kinase, smooth muscle isoform X2 [Ranitomeya imitator]|uniref:myosin light chain kinase, smooth muscle isoform X2 n=2 Tax=Ranitomeya imitator TaxID=111125 RepID=UPI0037E74CC5
MDGSQVVMNVEVTAHPPAEILWFHNGKEIQETEDFHFERSGDTYYLYIQEVFPEDTGMYTCEAWNSLGQARTEAMLTVQEPQEGTQPWFISKPKSMVLLPGQSALLSCAIAGDPFPEVQWMKDGQQLRDCDVLQNEDVFTLILRNVHEEDTGVYQICLRNAVGECSCQVSVVLQEDEPSAADTTLTQQREQPGFSERDGCGPDNALNIGEVSQRADNQESIRGVLKRRVEVKEHTEERLRQQEAEQLDFRNLLGKKVTTRTVSEEIPKVVSVEQMDFRANLQRQVKPKASSEDERKVNSPQQVDFRSVLGKKTPVSKPQEVEKVQAKPATPDFRSLLGNKKKVPTENGNANSTELHENAKPLSKEEKFKPLVKDEKPKPAVKEENAKPVVNQEKSKSLFTHEKAKPPAVKEEKLKPAIKEENDKPAVNQEKVKPLTKEENAKQAVNQEKAKPLTKEENAKPVLNQEKAKPLTKEENAKPVPNQEKAKPLTKEENAKPVLNQEKAKPLTKEENAKPVLNQEKAKVSVKEEVVKPALNLEKVKLSSKEETVKSASNEEGSKPLGKEDATKPAAVEETPKLAAKEVKMEQNCVSVVDGEVENKTTLESVTGTPPVFSEVLQDAKLVDGEKLVLQCRVASEPPPAITWTLDGKVIKSSKFIVLAQEGPLCSLTIEKTFPEDGGQYRCAAENCAGRADCTCNVTVEDTSGNTGIKKMKKPKSNAVPAIMSETSPPQILQFPEDRKVQAGESVELLCKVAGTQPISCMWMKFRREIKESEYIKIEKTEDSCKLTISSARQEHCGCYTLHAENKHGSKQAQINLTVFDKPDPPAGQPCASEMKGSALTLSWYGPTYDGGSVVQSYVVEIWDSVEKSWSDLTQCRSTSYNVENLLHDREYKFRVRATNVHGTSEPSQESEPVAYKEKVEEHKDEAEVSDDEGKETEPEYRDVVINTAQKVADFYDVEERLGTGKFGQVFRIVDKKTKKVWAGKFLKAYSAKDKESIRQEIDIMNCLHHPKLVQCIDAFESKSDMVMVLELVSGGELFERIIDEDFELTEREVIKYMKQIAEGVEFIHKQGIVHLDLKPENIMCVNKTGTKIKLIDFGLARRLESTPNLKVLFGTPEFVAPEVINYEPIGYATDMWSIGVICYILVSGLSPFMGDNDNETLANVTSATWDFDDEAFDEISEEAKNFISSLLKKDMKNRLNCTNCLQHTWLQQDTSTMEAKKLSKDRMKKYMARRKWQKTGHAVRAIGRLSSMAMISGLSSRKSSGSAPTSPLSTEAEGTEEDNQAFLESVSEERPPSKPVFTRTIMDIEVVEGSAARFDCRIEGHPDPEVIWYKDDQPIKESRHFQIDYDEDGNCSLTIAEVCGDDDAKYTCKAINSQGEASCKAELLVEVMAEEEEEEEEEEE